MRASLYIAKRYLIAKKSHNVINIISGISVIGVMVGTMALIVVLSVFNGFQSLISTLFSAFDPDLKITVAEGKVFDPTSDVFTQIKNMPGVIRYAEVLEENALLHYDDKEYIATIKGVSDSFGTMTGIRDMMVEGEFLLNAGNRPYAVIGQGVAYYLSVGLNFVYPIVIYVPKRTASVGSNPAEAFNQQYIYPSGIFSVEKETDIKYVLVPIHFARSLLEYEKEVSSLELKLDPGTDEKYMQKHIQNMLGKTYVVKNKYQQKEFFYKVMQSEKWAIFFILTFILIVASFNIIGSLTMLIIDKKKDMYILRSMGAGEDFIRRVFLFEGWMISVAGAIMGLILGIFICWLQQTFELLKLSGQSAFIVNAYPVDLRLSDVIHVFFTVLFIGFVAAWYPVRYITKKHLSEVETA